MLAAGDPATEILARRGARRACDLIAMAMHGHRCVADLVHGSVDAVRHRVNMPVLLLRAKKTGRKG